MNADALRTEIRLELDKLRRVVDELDALARDVAGRPATVREQTAAGAFPAQFYAGVERML